MATRTITINGLTVTNGESVKTETGKREIRYSIKAYGGFIARDGHPVKAAYVVSVNVQGEANRSFSNRHDAVLYVEALKAIAAHCGYTLKEESSK